jgi:outer membrane biosynthesis protein TonB
MRLLAAILAITLLAACAEQQTLSEQAAEQRTVPEQTLKAMIAKLRAHWRPPASIISQPDQTLVAVRFHLDREGRLSAPMEVRSNGSSPLYQSAVEAAKRAVELSQPFDMFSPFPYELWKTVEVNFDPRTFSIPGPPR